MPATLVAKLNPQDDLEAWQAEQRHGLGGNDAGAVLGIHPFMTPADVYNSKLGLLPPVVATPMMRRGVKLEAVAADEYMEATGIELVRGTEDLPEGILADSERPWLIGNFDRVVKGQRDIAEIKVVGLRAYAEMKAKGVRQYVWVQGQHYLGISGYDRVVFIIFSPEQWDFLGREQGGIWIERDEEFIAQERELLGEFWENNVKAGVAPAEPVDFDAETVPVVPASEIVTMDSPEWAEAALLLKEAKDIIAGGEELEERAQAQLKAMMSRANATVATGGCLKSLHWKPSKARETWDGKAMAAKLTALGQDVRPFKKTGNPSRPFKPYFVKEVFVD